MTPERFVPDPSREYPPEGADAYGALPEDLLAPSPPPQAVAAAVPTELPSGLTTTSDTASTVAPEPAPSKAEEANG